MKVREVVAVDSRIEQVTVYASGARVRRVAILRAPLPSVVRFAGLPLAVMDDTVRTEVEGGAVVTAVRVGVDAPSGDTRAEESSELRAAKRRVAIAESETARLREAIERLASASVVEDDPSEEKPAAWGAIVSARRDVVTLHAQRELALREALAAAARELGDARRALEVVVEKDRDAGSARAARLHEVRKHVELDLSGQGDATVRVEYQVPAARWAPSYVARLDGDDARFELRAVVAQDSGEDWTDVSLRLSTAEPERFALLPELQPQKIGRRQHEPAKRGFRAPPAGADALYGDYDRSFPKRSPIGAATTFDDSTYEGARPMAPDVTTRPADGFEDLSREVWDEDSSRSKDMYRGAPPPAMPASMPVMAPMSSRSKSSGGLFGAVAGAVAGTVAAPFALAAQAVTRNSAPGGGGVMKREDAAAAVAPTPRLDYGNLRMAPPSARNRGKLVAAKRELDADVATKVADAIAAIEQLLLPPGHVGEWAHNYDYAFAGDGKVDIKSDAAWHSIALTARSGKAKLRHVAVPREQADVFRVAAITNPFDGPLLPGPIDVYDRGQFLVTSDVDYTPPGGTVDIGLGVDPAVKIARNVEFHEEAAGMLRGALRLIHAITIDVENLSPRAIDLEVRERVPVTREGDDDVEVTLGKVDPAWDHWTPDPDAPRELRLRGAYRWQLELPATAKKLLRANYEVKIAGKHELVGGNRREP